MTAIRVRNPALFDRLRIQAMLRGIADQRGEAEMLRILEQALTTEFQRLDHTGVNRISCSEPQENS